MAQYPIRLLENLPSKEGKDIPKDSIVFVEAEKGFYPRGTVVNCVDATIIGLHLNFKDIENISEKYERLDSPTRVSFVTDIDRDKLKEIFQPSYIRELLDLANMHLYPKGNLDYLILEKLWGQLQECNFENAN